MKESFAMVISLLHVKEREAEEIDFAGVEVNYSAIQGAWPAPVNLGSLTGDVDRHVVCLMLQVSYYVCLHYLLFDGLKANVKMPTLLQLLFVIVM